MAVTLDDKLVVAISSRALFNFEEEHALFETGDPQAYMKLQLERLDVPAKPGIAYSLIKKLLAFNELGTDPGSLFVAFSDLTSGTETYAAGRFMDLVRTTRLDRHPALEGLGPEPLSAAFDADALARACVGKRTPLKSALLDQQVVAGLGNIYAVEALHVAGLSPQRRASTIATPTGAPRESAHRLTAAIKQVLAEAIDRQTSPRDRAERLRVSDRERARCRRPRGPGVIRRRTQAGRSTFYCPQCQH